MKRIILIAGLTLFSFSFVQAQTPSYGGLTRQQNIQKSKVLRKKAKPKSNSYQINNGTRENAAPQHPLTDNSSRAQPMVTKPLIPAQP